MATFRRRLVCSFFILLFCTVSALAQAIPADLDSYVDRTMKTFDVPGLAIAVVKDGKVVLTKGYGVREIGKPEKVDEHTLFGIASNTKAFTAAALAILIDEGKLNWDDPITTHLPWFQVYDPYVTRELTVRDALSHRSGLGLGAGDLMFFPPSTLTRDEILRRTRYVKPASSLRSKYAYNNIMFLAAGQIVPAITGKSWDDFVRERIFTQLGFTDSVIGTDAVVAAKNRVMPHSKIDNQVVAVNWQGMDNAGPAGAINASVSDLSKWILLQLNRGKIADGKKLFSEDRSREMWSPTTIVPIGKQPKPLESLTPNFINYGLGWYLRDYHGRKLVYHTGGLVGLVSKTLLVPEENLGIVVLTNQEQGGAFDSIIYHLLDHYLKLPSADWTAAFKQARDIREQEAAETVKKMELKRVAFSRPSLELREYTGDYRDAWYGLTTVGFENGGLTMSFSHSLSMVGDLKHFQYDTFVVHWRDRTIPDAYITFSLKSDGSIENAKMAPVSPLADFSFDFQDLYLTPVPKPQLPVQNVGR